jgi:oligopeptidase B
MNKTLLIAFLCLLILSCSSQESAETQASNVLTLKSKEYEQPVAKKVPHELSAHGHTRIDNYYWMRDDERAAPQVLSHLKAENAYTNAVMSSLGNLENTLFEEITGRLDKDLSDVPFFSNGYWYYKTYSGEQEYGVQYRKKGSLDAEEELLFDENVLSQNHDYFNLINGEASPNNKMYSFVVDVEGRRNYTLFIYSTEGDGKLIDTIENVTSSYEWGGDSQHIYYMTRDPQTLLANKVWRHELGSENNEDVLVYEEKDSTFYTWLYKSTDRSTIFIAHSHTDKTSASMLDASDPDAKPLLFQPIESDVEYWVDRKDDWYYIETNLEAKNYRIVRVKVNDFEDQEKWEEVIPHDENKLIDSYSVFDRHLVFTRLESGRQKAYIRDLEHNLTTPIIFSDGVYQVNFESNRDPSNAYVRFSYFSPTTPESIIDVDLESLKQTVQKQDRVLGGFESDNYQSEFIKVTARDGVEVPVTIYYRKDKFNKDGTNPLYQFGYGSYGITIEPNFVPQNISLLDRGFVIAIAHVRGSQKLGRQWYEDGKLKNKMNTFYDFIDVTQSLTAQGYADKEKVFAYGGSAGGLLMGAIVNISPELYKGVAAAVPFVDVVTTMSDETLPLTANEWTEWGNPILDESEYHYMLSYSPYDNVAPREYPHMLVTAGLHDSQVGYFEASKWVAKLREFNTSDSVILLDTDLQAGHSGASGRFARYREYSRRFAFFCTLVDACEK